VILAANISIPPMIPLIVFGSYKLGACWMPDQPANISFDWKLSVHSIRFNLQQYIYGSITLALISGLFFLMATFLLVKIFRRKTMTAV
jgi:uncharacterized protein (DUF2062 family)